MSQQYNAAPTIRQWNGIKHLFCYLRGTHDFDLFYHNCPNGTLVGYADAGYLSNPHKAKSQNGYVFTYGDTAISWKSTK